MDKEIEVTLLSKEQVFGKNRLKIFNGNDFVAPFTDFAILLGGYVSDYRYNALPENIKYFYENDKDRIGSWFTKSLVEDRVCIIRHGHFGDYEIVKANWSSNYGVRPVLPYSLIKEYALDRPVRKNGHLEIKYGMYPQYIVSENLKEILEEKHKKGFLKKTEKKYTINRIMYSDKNYDEYEYNGKKYIRFVYGYTFEKTFNGKKLQKGDVFWIEVEPITWIIDKKNDIALSKTVLLSDINFDLIDEYNGNFEETFMYKFLNTHFIKDIQVQEEKIEKDENKDEIEKLFKEIKKYSKYSDNIDELRSYLNGLIVNYNKKVTSILDDKIDLNLGTVSVDSCKANLILKLQLKLDELESLYGKSFRLEEIMHLLENYRNILNGIEVNTNDELTYDFKMIYESLTFIKNPKLTLEFTNLIEKEIEKIKNYLNKSENINVEYDDIKTFNLYLRFQLHPLLVRLNSNAVNKDVLMEIKEMIKNEMYKIDKTQKTSAINFYLTLINESIKRIRKLDKDNKYNKEIEKIVTMDIDNLKLVTDIICKLYGIEICLKESNYIKNNIKKHIITKTFI